MNTKVPLCCASNDEVYTTDNLVFINTTTLRVVGGQDVTVKIYRNTGGMAMHDCMMVDGLIQAHIIGFNRSPILCIGNLFII